MFAFVGARHAVPLRSPFHVRGAGSQRRVRIAHRLPTSADVQDDSDRFITYTQPNLVFAEAGARPPRQAQNEPPCPHGFGVDIPVALYVTANVRYA